MRQSNWLGLVTLGIGILMAVAVLDSHYRRSVYNEQIGERLALQKIVGLTDLSITTAARYLRHYSLTDMTTPFQDYPVAMDHFPAGFAFAAPSYKGMPSPIVLKQLNKPTSIK